MVPKLEKLVRLPVFFNVGHAPGSTIEKELLALLHCIKKFRYYILGNGVTICHTDNSSQQNKVAALAD